MEPLDYFPAHLREAASKLPVGEQYTVLTLPDPGEGHNAGLISVAATCYKLGVSMEDALAHLRVLYDSDRKDYQTAPNRAIRRVWANEGDIPSDGEDKGENLTPQAELLLRFKRTSAAAVIGTSPASTGTHPKDIVHRLFEPTDVLCIQKTGREGGTLVRCSDLPDDISPYKFLNPSTFKKVEGLDVEQPGGEIKHMTRCNENVKKRPFMVLEYDGTKGMSDGELRAAVERFTTFAFCLAKFAPLVLAVDTGNKSIHFWYDTSKTKPDIVAKFFAQARMHGADKQLAVKSQIARMPNVSSSGEGRDAQTVLFFDPERKLCPKDGLWDILGFEKYIQDAKQLEYYYSGKGTYYMQGSTERWITLNRFSLSKQLAVQGYRDVKVDTEMVSPVDGLIAGFESDRAIEAALTGASGKHAGYYEDNGFNYLVLKSPMLLKPRQGSWVTIERFFQHMFQSDPLQFLIFNGLLSSSIKDFRNGGKRESRISPCQALHIAGDNDSGKSFINKFILPALFGGRWANAESYFKLNGGEHNSEMFMSELLILDDTSVLETSHRARKIMTEKIKEITVGSGQGYRGMFQDRITSRPWWRLFRMLNSTPDDLATLPLTEKGADDKWVLLHATTMDGGSVDKTKPNWFEPWKDQIVSELPAYLHYLLREMTISDDAKDPTGRYAVRSYKNPLLMDSLQEDSLETYLLHRIDNEAHATLFSDPFEGDSKNDWRGCSGKLYDILCEVGSIASQRRFSKTCPSPRVLSSQLKLLEMAHPTRFKYSNCSTVTPRKLDGSYYWLVTPKTAETTEEDCF